ncbi:MAG: type II toxin-antitoxin system RelE/ParE family toxin, partial [Cyanobacteriota bacterium]
RLGVLQESSVALPRVSVKKILVSEEFKKQFRKYDKKLQERISKAIDKLPEGKIKKLQGKRIPPLYRIRVGDYRIIFRMNEDEIFIEIVDKRDDVYKNI